MTFEVQQTRWDRIIRRVTGSIGPGSRVSETLSELFPVLDVERVPGELLVLGGTNICFGGGGINAAAGQAGTAALFNPADSGVIATVTAFVISPRVISILRWGVVNVQFFPVIGTELIRDTRRTFTDNPACQVSQRSSVILPAGTNQSFTPGLGPFHFSDENGVAVLAPGTGFEIGTDALGQEFFYSFYWRERPAEESELSL